MGHHHHPFGVFIGPGLWWDPFWYPYAAYPWYPYPPVVTLPESLAYVQQQAEASAYWYYCADDAKAYYPYVQECPGGWLTVAPTPTTPTAPAPSAPASAP